MFSMSYSSNFRTRSSIISSRHLATSRSLASTGPMLSFHPASNSHPQYSSHPSIYRSSHPPPKMYYDDYDPRVGPAAMPSPHSEYAPYYSGYADTFEDFLDEFEGKAYDCELTDPQRVDAIIRYVDLSIHELCRSLIGFRPRDWTLFRQSLLDTFGSTTPRPQVMRQKLQCYIQDSSRSRMDCIDDVLQYYRQFLCYSAPLVHAGHLTEEDRDAAFWRGFHPEDCKVLWPRLIGKNPIQPPDTPFYFEDVFHCARAAFAYDGASLSWSPEYQFKPSSVRREQPVAEHVSRDTCGPREVSRAVVSNAEMESTHSSSELLSPPTPDPQLPTSSSLSTSELQHPHTRSATVDQPEDDAPTFSIPSSTLLPSTSSVPTPSLPPSVADDYPEHAPTFSNSSLSTLPPSASPTQSISHSLARSAADDVPEVTSAPPSSFSKSFDPERMTSVRMAIDDQPEPETAPISLIPQELDSPTCAPLPPSEPPSRLAVDHAPSPLTFDSSPVLPASSQLPASLLLPLVVGNLEFEYVPPSAVDVVPPSSPEPSPSSLSEVILHTPDANPRTRAPILPFGATLFDSDPRAFEMTLARASSTVLSNVQPVSPPIKISLNVFISPHSSPQQSLGVTPDGSVTSPLETAPAPASPSIPSVPKQVPTAQWLLYLVPQLLQEPSLVYEASSTPASRFSHYSPPLRMSGSRSAHFDFALIIVTTAVLVFVFPNVLATFLSHARKFGNKNKDLSDRQNSNLKTGNMFAQRLRLQYTQHGKRFVFDPGGLASSLALESTHENARGRKPKTRGGFVTTHDATLPTPILAGNLIVFVAETLKFFSRRSLTGDGQDLNPLGGVRPALGLGLKRASRCHIGVTPFPGVPCILPYLF
ncbi:hypothetical protein BJY52DRAFT_602411 [Lactarius psammicola]|nr:hypothetical protein BJY52DRAFT_602411 [Lactarius psammicola]